MEGKKIEDFAVIVHGVYTGRGAGSSCSATVKFFTLNVSFVLFGPPQGHQIKLLGQLLDNVIAASCRDEDEGRLAAEQD